MRLHSDKLISSDIYSSLTQVKKLGLVSNHVYFYIDDERGSRKRTRAWEIQLGTDVKIKGDKRGYKNSGKYGADTIYAATYDEWGWYIAALFEKDPDLIFGTYKGVDDYNRQTKHKFANLLAVV